MGLPSHMIAMLVSQIGWRVGLWPRRLGAAAMKARAAHQQLAGVLRSRAGVPWQRFCCKVIPPVQPDSCSTGIRAIFGCAASAFLMDRIEEESRLKRWPSCHLPVLDLSPPLRDVT